MFCTNCGARLPEGSHFCPQCGAEAKKAAPSEGPESGIPVTDRITLFPDGKYRWIRQADLLKNASQLKFVLLCTGIPCFLFSLLMCWGSGLTDLGLWECLKLVLIVTFGGLGAALVTYVLAVQAMGRRFCYLYEMDKDRILISRRLTQNQDLRWSIAGYAMGLASDPVFAMDLYNLMTDHSAAITISSVRSVHWESDREAEKLKGSFGSRRVYLDPEDLPVFTAHLKNYSPELHGLS